MQFFVLDPSEVGKYTCNFVHTVETYMMMNQMIVWTTLKLYLYLQIFHETCLYVAVWLAQSV